MDVISAFATRSCLRALTTYGPVQEKLVRSWDNLVRQTRASSGLESLNPTVIGLSMTELPNSS